MLKQNWNAQHLKYANTDWINKPSFFAQDAIKFFPATGKILDVGCGQGQDSRFFAEHNYEVVGVDFSDQGIDIAKEKSNTLNIIFKILDISEPFPYTDNTFDVIYSHLALHYFNEEKTKLIFKELSRLLKKEGILAILVNSIHDPEYGTGEKLEKDYFTVGTMQKHYFSKESLENYIEGFETLISNENGETYKDRAIGVRSLVQYIGKKL